jgi:acyl-CoA thioesterase-1
MPHFRSPLARLGLLVLLTLAACGRNADKAAPERAPAPAAPAAAPDLADSGHPKIVVLGDSLSAGLGLLEQQAYPALLQQKLNADGYQWDVVNAGISGDTSAAGLQRVDWALGQGDVRILVLELGANDGLRGLPIAEMKKNLAGIIERAKERRIAVLLAGMEAPPNFGDDYTTRFRAVYPALAKKYQVPLIPFLLAGVAGDPALNQADGIHPNPRGAQIVADLVWRTLQTQLTATRQTTK